MKKRVFIGMTEIAGYYGQLAKGLRKRGYPVTFLGGNDHVFQYKQSKEDSSLFSKIYKASLSFSSRAKSVNPVSRVFCLFFSNSLRLALFFLIALSHDIFIFGFGTSLLPCNVDLPILRILGKCIICNIAHGSDARPPYIDGSYLNDKAPYFDLDKIKEIAKKIKKRCCFIEKNSHFVIGAPLTSHFLKYKFVDWFKIGIPVTGESVVISKNKENDEIRILHSPSNPILKGTQEIEKAVACLIKKGYKVNFMKLINVPNSDVIKEILRCDFVVDQIYSDTPLATFATEAAWFGKPAIVGGYGWEILNKCIEKNLFPPSLTCCPENIEDAMERIIIDKEYREDLGARSQSFVRDFWGTDNVSGRYIRLIEGNVPCEWYADPSKFNYVYGCGLPYKTSRHLIKKMILKYGVDSLQLSDKPDLERAFVEFAGLGPDVLA